MENIKSSKRGAKKRYNSPRYAFSAYLPEFIFQAVDEMNITSLNQFIIDSILEKIKNDNPEIYKKIQTNILGKLTAA